LGRVVVALEKPRPCPHRAWSCQADIGGKEPAIETEEKRKKNTETRLKKRKNGAGPTGKRQGMGGGKNIRDKGNSIQEKGGSNQQGPDTKHNSLLIAIAKKRGEVFYTCRQQTKGGGQRRQISKHQQKIVRAKGAVQNQAGAEGEGGGKRPRYDL